VQLGAFSALHCDISRDTISHLQISVKCAGGKGTARPLQRQKSRTLHQLPALSSCRPIVFPYQAYMRTKIERSAKCPHTCRNTPAGSCSQAQSRLLWDLFPNRCAVTRVDTRRSSYARTFSVVSVRNAKFFRCLLVMFESHADGLFYSTKTTMQRTKGLRSSTSAQYQQAYIRANSFEADVVSTTRLVQVAVSSAERTSKLPSTASFCIRRKIKRPM
jgi:hypothetical protein